MKVSGFSHKLPLLIQTVFQSLASFKVCLPLPYQEEEAEATISEQISLKVTLWSRKVWCNPT